MPNAALNERKNASAVSNDVFKRALARLAAGVTIVSTALNEERRGVTATAVCSVSASPPTLLTCINSSTGTCKMIEESGFFAVNLLSEWHYSVAHAFAGRSGLQGADRFVHGYWVKGEQHAMPILDSAVAALECRVDKVVHAGTHAVFFGLIEEAYFGEQSPLIYHDGNFHGLLFKLTPNAVMSSRTPAEGAANLGWDLEEISIG